jgi:hypothetical protein
MDSPTTEELRLLLPPLVLVLVHVPSWLNDRTG